ncbi:MAG: hypothetical protein ABR606_02150 [Vicinamibacterales bacterium]
MSADTRDRARQPRVRPALRRIAIGAFVILLPVAAHSLWDHIEIRRLVREIETIRDKGEPVSERRAVAPYPSSGEARGAASYYLAGAMLALDASRTPVNAAVRKWLAAPTADQEILQQIAAPLHQYVEQSRDALVLADTAARLHFAGFPAGSEYSYRVAALGSLSRLIAARTLSSSLTGQAEAAVDSAISGLQARRALREAHWPATSVNDVAGVLSLTEPPPEALRRLQVALEAEDKPERMAEGFLGERARYVERLWRRYYGSDPHSPRHYTLPTRSLIETVLRPWLTHDAVAALRLWAELGEVVRTPWPQKGSAIAAAQAKYGLEDDRRPSRPLGLLMSRGLPFSAFRQAVDAGPLIIDRSARVAVAVERFRRDHAGAVPETLAALVPRYLSDIPPDPFTGAPLLYKTETDAYTIYSVGSNHEDDGGDLTSEWRISEDDSGRRVLRSADIGVRVVRPR